MKGERNGDNVPGSTDRPIEEGEGSRRADIHADDRNSGNNGNISRAAASAVYFPTKSLKALLRVDTNLLH